LNKSSGLFIHNAGFLLRVLDNSIKWAEEILPQNIVLNTLVIENRGGQDGVLKEIMLDITNDFQTIGSVMLFEDTDNSGDFNSGDKVLGERNDSGIISLDLTVEKESQITTFIVAEVISEVVAGRVDFIIEESGASDLSGKAIGVSGIPLSAGTIKFFGDITFKNGENPEKTELFFGDEEKKLFNFSMISKVDTELLSLIFEADILPENIEFKLVSDGGEFLATIYNNTLIFDTALEIPKDEEMFFKIYAKSLSQDDFLPFRLKLLEDGVDITGDFLFAGLPLVTPLITPATPFSYQKNPLFRPSSSLAKFEKIPMLSITLKSALPLQIRQINPAVTAENVVETLYIVEDVNSNSIFDPKDQILASGAPSKLGNIELNLNGEKNIIILGDIYKTAMPGTSFSIVADKNSFNVLTEENQALIVTGKTVQSEIFVVPPAVVFENIKSTGALLEEHFSRKEILSFQLLAKGDTLSFDSLRVKEKIGGNCKLFIYLYEESDNIEGLSQDDKLIAAEKSDVSAYKKFFPATAIKPDENRVFYIGASADKCSGTFSIEADEAEFTPDSSPDYGIIGLPFESSIFSAFGVTVRKEWKSNWISTYFQGAGMPLFVLENKEKTAETFTITSTQKIILSGGNDINGNMKIEPHEKLCATNEKSLTECTIPAESKILLSLESLTESYADIFINGMPAGRVLKEPFFAVSTDKKNFTVSGKSSDLKIITLRSAGETLSYKNGEKEESCVKKVDQIFDCTTTLLQSVEKLEFSASVDSVDLFSRGSDSYFPLNLRASAEISSIEFMGFSVASENIINFQIASFGENEILFKGLGSIKIDEKQYQITEKGVTVTLDSGVFKAELLSSNITASSNDFNYFVSEVKELGGSKVFVHGNGSYSENFVIPSYTFESSQPIYLSKIESPDGETSFVGDDGIIYKASNSQKNRFGLIPQSVSKEVFNSEIIFTAQENTIAFTIPFATKKEVSIIKSGSYFVMTTSGASLLKKLTFSVSSATYLESFGNYALLEVLSDGKWVKTGFSEIKKETSVETNIQISETAPIIFRISFAGQKGIPDKSLISTNFMEATFAKEAGIEERVVITDNFISEESSTMINVTEKDKNSILFEALSDSIEPLFIDSSCEIKRSDEGKTLSFTCSADGVFGISSIVSSDFDKPIFGQHLLFVDGIKKETKKEKLTGGGCSALVI